MGRHEGRRPACCPGVLLSGLSSSLASFPSQVIWSLGRWEIRICSLGPVRWRLEGLDWRVRHLPRACSEMAAALCFPGGRRRGPPAVAAAQGASRRRILFPWRALCVLAGSSLGLFGNGWSTWLILHQSGRSRLHVSDPKDDGGPHPEWARVAGPAVCGRPPRRACLLGSSHPGSDGDAQVKLH